MELQQAIELISTRHLLSSQTACWADLGCGRGLFTVALMHLLPANSTIYAIDQNKSLLKDLPSPSNDSTLQKMQGDFIRDELPLNQLDGLLMANSLHFVQDKISFLYKAQQWLKTNGVFLIAEYNTDTANPWVPYPISFASLSSLFEEVGYKQIEKIHERPSLFNRANIYSALIQR